MKKPTPLGITLPIIHDASIPGSGMQKATTQAVAFESCYVTSSTRQALLLDFPLKGRELWVARSQLCTKEGMDTLTEDSKPGDKGTVLLPLFIVKRLFPAAKEVPAKP